MRSAVVRVCASLFRMKCYSPRAPRAPFLWTVTGRAKEKLCGRPHCLFGLEFAQKHERIRWFLEADGGAKSIEPLEAKGGSIARKRRAYAATWKADTYRSRFGASRLSPHRYL